MPKKDKKAYFLDKPGNVKRLLGGFYALCILLIVADFIIHRHTTMDWEKITAFYAIFGFVSCVALVLIAKKLRTVIMRKENYYNE